MAESPCGRGRQGTEHTETCSRGQRFGSYPEATEGCRGKKQRAAVIVDGSISPKGRTQSPQQPTQHQVYKRHLITLQRRESTE